MRFSELKQGDCFSFEDGICIKTCPITTWEHTFNAVVLFSRHEKWFKRGDYLVMFSKREVERIIVNKLSADYRYENLEDKINEIQ